MHFDAFTLLFCAATRGFPRVGTRRTKSDEAGQKTIGPDEKPPRMKSHRV